MTATVVTTSAALSKKNNSIGVAIIAGVFYNNNNSYVFICSWYLFYLQMSVFYSMFGDKDLGSILQSMLQWSSKGCVEILPRVDLR